MLEGMWQEVKVDYKTTKLWGQCATGSRARKAKSKSFHTAVHTVKQQ